jgi:hypothetical protein
MVGLDTSNQTDCSHTKFVSLHDQKDQDMDSPVKAIAGSVFRSPPRILIPKLVRSRNLWKAKATARKRQYRQEKIRSRDLTHSRQRWKERARSAEQKLLELHQELQRTQADLAAARAQVLQLQDDSKKS